MNLDRITLACHIANKVCYGLMAVAAVGVVLHFVVYPDSDWAWGLIIYPLLTGLTISGVGYVVMDAVIKETKRQYRRDMEDAWR